MVRYKEYGKYDSEWAYFATRTIKGYSPVLDSVCGSYSTTDTGGEQTMVGYDANAIGMSRYNKDNRSTFLKVGLTVVRSQLGYSPVMLYADVAIFGYLRTPARTSTVAWYLVRAGREPDLTDCTKRYLNGPSTTTWTEDAYSPVPGADIDWTPFYSGTFVCPTSVLVANNFIPVTDQLLDALKRNRDLWLYALPQYPVPDRENCAWYYPTTSEYMGKRPYLRMFYVWPIEFYQASAGEIDLARMVDNATSANPFYLGALERGATGTPVQGFIRNYSGSILPLVEVLDDHPEWSTPVQTTGTGTGSLGYVALATGAVSQKYTIIFTSGSAFWVKAEAYRDNIASLNPTDSDAAWRGSVSGDLVCPEGSYLTIPAAAWADTADIDSGDEFEVYVRGNSSDSSWPSDSGEQIQITRDSAGSPDNAGWRAVAGQRTVSTSSTTLSADPITVDVRQIDSSLWTLGARCFIGDGTNLHEGTVSAATATTVEITGMGTDSTVYAAGARVGTSLPFANLAAAIWLQTSAVSGDGETPSNVIYCEDPDVAGFAAAQVVHIVDVTDITVEEYATVSSVDSTSIEVSTALLNSYPAGSLVSVRGVGEAAFWLRGVSGATTAEELKTVRLVARV